MGQVPPHQRTPRPFRQDENFQHGTSFPPLTAKADPVPQELPLCLRQASSPPQDLPFPLLQADSLLQGTTASLLKT